MPRIFSYKEFSSGSAEVVKYADKHSPIIICPLEAQRDVPFKVKVRIGSTVKHPNTAIHHFEYIQLWNLETLVGEIRLNYEEYGNDSLFIEKEFTVVPKVSLRLMAVAYCNKHGLWSSDEVFVKVKD